MRLNNHQRRRISLGVKRYVELPKTMTNNAEKRENIRSQKGQTVSQYNTIQYNTISASMLKNKKILFQSLFWKKFPSKIVKFPSNFLYVI